MLASLATAHRLAPSLGLMVRVALGVVALHALALWWWTVAIAPTAVVKRPDILIELSGAPPAVAPTVPVVEAAPSPKPLRPAELHPSTSSASSTSSAPSLPPPRPQPAPSVPDAPVIMQLTTPVAPVAASASESPSPAAASPAPQASASPQPAVLPTAQTVDADYKAAYLNNPKPRYPAAAVRRGAQGRVLLLAEVLPDGRAGRVQLEQSSGHAVLDAEAMNTVRVWRFTPARKDGVIVTQTVRIPIEFNLNEAR